LAATAASKRVPIRIFGSFDDSALASGHQPIDEGALRAVSEASMQNRSEYRNREQQSVKLGPDDAAGVDACFRLGDAFQLKGASASKQVVALVGGAHQIVLPIVVRNGKFDEIRPALEAAVRAGKLQCKVLSVDDMGAAASSHGNGARYLETITTLEAVMQDSMHQQNRVSKTQQKDHADHAEATQRLKRCFRRVSDAAYDEVKTLVCYKTVGAAGGLVVKTSASGKPLSTKLLVGLKPRAYLDLRDKGGQRAMSSTKFDEYYLSDNRPNEVFEAAFDGAFEHTDHTAASARLRLATTYRWAAGRRAPPCGTCDGCLPGEPTQQEVDAAAAVRAATNRLAALQCLRRRREARAGAGADEEEAPAPVPAPAPTPHRENMSDDDRDDDHRSPCVRVRRRGRFDDKGRLLNSVDAKGAFEAASRNAEYMPWPLHLCPRMKPIISSGGERKVNTVGMPLSYSQAGTSLAENTFGRAERVLSSKAGYKADYASLLGGEFSSKSNTVARQNYLGEPNVGHNKLWLLEQIDQDYEAIGEPKYYPWRLEPDPFDPDRLYWGAYDKQQHPEQYDVGPPPPPPPPPAANAPRPPPQQFVSNARAQFYRATTGGPDIALPPDDWLLAVDIERGNDRTLPCPCPRSKTAQRTMRDRKHPLPYCLHGIALRLQQSRGGGARRGKARRERR